MKTMMVMFLCLFLLSASVGTARAEDYTDSQTYADDAWRTIWDWYAIWAIEWARASLEAQAMSCCQGPSYNPF